MLGHSYGALICLEAALRVANLNKLILYEPAFYLGEPLYPSDVKVRIQSLLDSGNLEEVLVLFFREAAGMSEDQIEAMRNEPVWAGRLKAAHTIPREFADENYKFDPRRFENLTVPTMLLQGGESPEFLKKATEILHAALPNSRVVVMPGQQHIAMRTAPEMFVRLVTDFLTGSI